MDPTVEAQRLALEKLVASMDKAFRSFRLYEARGPQYEAHVREMASQAALATEQGPAVLTVTPHGGTAAVSLSVWDLGGQVAYAAAQQPYIVPGSLYFLVVPAHRATDKHYSEVLGRWLDYLQARRRQPLC